MGTKQKKRKRKYKPSKWDTVIQPRITEIAAWCRDGLTDQEIAKRLGMARSTFNKHKAEHEELREVLKRNKEVADVEVEDSLFKRANGYEYEERKVVKKRIPPKYGDDGEEIEPSRLVIVKEEVTRKKVAPDTTACIFWLKNRKPGVWRDKQEIDHSSSDGSMATKTDDPIDYGKLSTDTLRDLLQASKPGPDEG